MSLHLLIAVSAIYAYVACDQFWRGNAVGALIFANYACANICLSMLNK